jgi:hypothetical protein
MKQSWETVRLETTPLRPLAPMPGEIAVARQNSGLFGWGPQPTRPAWAQTLVNSGVDARWTDLQVGMGRSFLDVYQDATAPRQQTLALSPELEEKRGSSMDGWTKGLDDAFGPGVQAAGIERMVRLSDYPWWWGQVNGYTDIARSIQSDIVHTRTSNVPAGLKRTIIGNLNYAHDVAREVWNVFPR